MSEVQLTSAIVVELKRILRKFVEGLNREHPTDHFYAYLLEIDPFNIYCFRVAGSDECLTRLAHKYIAKGYRASDGDTLDQVRAMLRWDAPGDDSDGWYGRIDEDDRGLFQLVLNTIDEHGSEQYSENPWLRPVYLQALRELDSEGLFGTGSEREQVLVGLTCCDEWFGDERTIAEFATLNPPATIERLREQLTAERESEKRVKCIQDLT